MCRCQESLVPSQGAVNLHMEEDVEDFLLKKPIVPTDGKRVIVVFHCEFSSERGPRMWVSHRTGLCSVAPTVLLWDMVVYGSHLQRPIGHHKSFPCLSLHTYHVNTQSYKSTNSCVTDVFSNSYLFSNWLILWTASLNVVYRPDLTVSVAKSWWASPVQAVCGTSVAHTVSSEDLASASSPRVLSCPSLCWVWFTVSPSVILS